MVCISGISVSDRPLVVAVLPSPVCIVAANRVAIILYCIQLIPTYAVVYFCAYEAVELKCLRVMLIDR